jgi:aspartate carbamoyltransferase catalytic subunit
MESMYRFQHRDLLGIDQLFVSDVHLIFDTADVFREISTRVEITNKVADGPYSVILNQATNGVAIRMALLYLLIGGGKDDHLD